MLIHRVYVTHATPRSLMRQRVLVVGTGTRAKLVGKSLTKSDPNIDLVGYYASPNEVVTEVSAWGLLSPEKSLTDIVVDEQVDEIVVALSERRGGSMPLRELLDCKLHGVRVADIATHFEKTFGANQARFCKCRLAYFWRRIRARICTYHGETSFRYCLRHDPHRFTLPIMLVTGILILIESGGQSCIFRSV